MKAYGKKMWRNDETRFATDFEDAAGCDIAMQNDLNDFSGRKIIWRADGTFDSTTAPISLIIDNRYKSLWLQGGQLVVCSNERARTRNKIWERIREMLENAGTCKMPILYGDIVFMRPGRSIRWKADSETFVEMLMYCQQVYGRFGSGVYNFCH